MKYQVGDIVAFDLPILAENNKSGRKHGAGNHAQRFAIGKVKAMFEEEQSYQIVALTGGLYTIPEGLIGGRTDFV